MFLCVKLTQTFARFFAAMLTQIRKFHDGGLQIKCEHERKTKFTKKKIKKKKSTNGKPDKDRYGRADEQGMLARASFPCSK